ncbi:MAG: hypothetical protein E7331_09610 [Clostridiales bacterium]|nr:hypothetical protein [Clostridiales bacterium]
MQDTILILSQEPSAAALVAHTFRWRQLYSTIQPASISYAQAMECNPRGFVLVGRETMNQLDPAFFESDIPLLALGEAAAELCLRCGGETGNAVSVSETVQLTHHDDILFDSITSGERRLKGYSPMTLPENAEPVMFANEDCIAFRLRDKSHYGVQYPIERHDPDGAQLLSNFAQQLCNCRANWDSDAFIDDSLDEIRKKTEGCEKVVCAVSGGVDSAVCARLTSLAAGNRLYCIFIDTGFFHQDEPETIISDFREYMGIDVVHIDARERFLNALAGICGDAEKDQAVSALIREIILDVLASLGQRTAVVLGTNFSEMLDGYASAVEGGEARPLPYPVVEPLKKLFKDEVRSLAQDLQLPVSFSGRQSFPAAGLASRIFGEVTEERLAVLRQAEVCFTDEIIENGFDRRLRKFYAVLLRSPEAPDAYSISLRALQAGRTNVAARLPFDLLERVTERILGEIHSVSRVVYDLTPSKSNGEME